MWTLLAKWVDQDKLRVDVDPIHGFDWDGAMAAYEHLITGKARGKVCLQLDTNR